MSRSRGVYRQQTPEQLAIDGRRRPRSEDTKTKIKKALSGRKNPGKTQPKQTLIWRLRISLRLRGKRHTAEHNAKVSAAHIGMQHSDETRRKLSESHSRHKKDCRCAGCYKKPFGTQLEKKLLVLLDDFPTVLAQQRFGQYSVDAYLPEPYRLAFEADGYWWHSTPEQIRRDALRDAVIFQRFGVPVIRLTEADLQVIGRPR